MILHQFRWLRQGSAALARTLFVSAIALGLFDKVDDATPELGVLEPHEGLGERKPIRRGKEVGHVGWRRSIAFGLSRRMRRTLEEEGHGYLQDLRDMLELARAHPVGALLVLLNLLERQAKGIRERRLATFLRLFSST
jgi:hypothetical protein